LRLPERAAILVCACLIAAGGAGQANGQGAAPSCPYSNGMPPVAACGPNAGPLSIPQGGSRITPNECARVRFEALASLYSYDDASCHPKKSGLPKVGSSNELTFILDALEVLPDNYKKLAQDNDVRAGLYCDVDTNTLILAFRGSVSLTQILSTNGILDWYYTNFAQHFGPPPIQYSAADDIADLVSRRLADFDNVCGPGRPNFILTGHSKGGGQAQDAASKYNLEAVVFNSDIPNPVAFTGWMLQPPALIAPLISRLRAFLSLYTCVVGSVDDPGQFQAYVSSGKLKDVRMVNDPLSKVLFSLCSNNLPHPPISWVENTLSCSGDGGNSIKALIAGHSMETVVRELQVCAGP
jgi:hypothetical protein